jgi:hypothetical protein
MQAAEDRHYRPASAPRSHSFGPKASKPRESRGPRARERDASRAMLARLPRGAPTRRFSAARRDAAPGASMSLMPRHAAAMHEEAVAMTLRLGELMVRRNVLTQDQVDTILQVQKEQGRPFGDIAENLFGVDPIVVEDLWAEQYASQTARIDPRREPIENGALSVLTARQAWQFRLLPVRRDGEGLMICTTLENLARAVRFTYRALGQPAYFVLTEPGALGEALARYYPMPGMSPASVSGAPWIGLASGALRR